MSEHEFDDLNAVKNMLVQFQKESDGKEALISTGTIPMLAAAMEVIVDKVQELEANSGLR